MRSIIPNTLTSINLACGCVAVLAFLNHYYLLGIILIFVAAVADFFDGFVARLLHVQSDLGKELDSLADMVSFGMVPGVIIFVALCKSYELNSFEEIIEAGIYLPLIGFLITVFSGLRLAKFNIDTRQSTSFIGLPTPANTLFFLTLPMIWIAKDTNYQLLEITSNTYVLVGLTLIFSFLLVAEIPLIALKFKGFGLKNNLFRYLLIGTGIVSVILFQYLCIPIILIGYILLSIIETKVNKGQL